jgi:hypothetical protein
MNRSDTDLLSFQGDNGQGAKRNSAADSGKVNTIGSLVAALSLAACVMVLAGPELALGDPIINAAADRLNTITPQAVPQQTIRIGTYDGSTKKFTWNLPEECPQNLPAFKCEEQGGPAKYDHVATINSFNVKYEFEIRNRPANFQLTLTVPDASGQMVSKAATLNPAGTLASVAFNTHFVAPQNATISPSGNLGPLKITPRLKPQLGAFVVPYMLISIVYEPPGDYSYAWYSKTSTVGSVVSWSFSRTSGMWETVDPNQLVDLFRRGGVAYVKAVYGETAGAVAGVMNELIGQTSIESMTTMTKGVSSSKGWYMSVTQEFGTTYEDAYKYPGQGDRFIVLTNVLFAYFSSGNKVHLMPVAYSKPVRGFGAYELKNALPPALADKWLALDPLVGNKLSMLRLAPKLGYTPFGRAGSRFTYFGTTECAQSGPDGFKFGLKDFSSTGRFETVTETTIEKGTGFLYSTAGTTNVLGYSYSSSAEQYTSDEEVASIYTQCGPNDVAYGACGHEVDAYFDSVFRTFLPVRGKPLSPCGASSASAPAAAPSAVSGTVSDEQGRPLAKQQVTLTLADKRYFVLTDNKGNFAFRFGPLPKGGGSLGVGRSTSPITYAGNPIRDLKLKVSRSLLPAVRLPSK